MPLSILVLKSIKRALILLGQVTHLSLFKNIWSSNHVKETTFHHMVRLLIRLHPEVKKEVQRVLQIFEMQIVRGLLCDILSQICHPISILAIDCEGPFSLLRKDRLSYTVLNSSWNVEYKIVLTGSINRLFMLLKLQRFPFLICLCVLSQPMAGWVVLESLGVSENKISALILYVVSFLSQSQP